MNPKGQAYINYIEDELRKGNVGFRNVFTVFASKFQLSEKTFSKYWKLANTAYSERMAEIKAEKDSIQAEHQSDTAKRSLLTSDQKREALAKIVLNDFSKDADKIRAINELNRMDGDHSAQKVENTIKGKYDDLTEEQIRKELKRLKDV